MTEEIRTDFLLVGAGIAGILLASKLAASGKKIDEINLGSLHPDERKLLMQLVKQLYSMVEVRFVAAKEAPWGECQVDRLRYTRAPQ